MLFLAQISILFYSTLFCSIPGCVLPLQEVALRQSLPSFSVLCYPRPYRSMLPLNVISPTTFWSSDWSYTLCLLLCASNSPSIISHSGDVSFSSILSILLSIARLLVSSFFTNAFVRDQIDWQAQQISLLICSLAGQRCSEA